MIKDSNNAMVHFVGAGPGAEDLITVRGARLLEEAACVVYAGSLVNPDHLSRCKADCASYDSASMSLEEQVSVMAEAALAGKAVVRLHTGDPAMYGAINEQIALLAERGVESRIVPGVSSVFGAAAALGCQLTAPEISQSLVLTRSAGRTPMPEKERASAFAKTGATLVFFLSVHKCAELMQELQNEGDVSGDTPAAVVYRATWEDERVVRGTVATIAEEVEKAGIGRQALIFVGRALGESRIASKLYDAEFSHGYRSACHAGKAEACAAAVVEGVKIAEEKNTELKQVQAQGQAQGKGTKQGSVLVVGLGSGSARHISPEVQDALAECDTVAGYKAYLNFVRERIAGKKIIESGMMGEVARCTAALRAAQNGERVCVVCSGDPGILAMAGLLFELRSSNAEFADIPVRVLAGITSANIAAAALGAPLQNGFCLVSLSDLLVPADEVRANLRACASSHLPVALYNPAGKKRRELLAEALNVFAEARGGQTLCAIVRHAGRPEEWTWKGELSALPQEDVDMSSLLIIGSARTRLDAHGALYEARGYADKYGV